ncbi:ABC transporter ATP-binding protein [Marinobacter subterrani]|uniref:ABC-type cobalamin/Fe3+-siderophores transport system, ATPase component n=1 Tax=Marinobacter subterrani TaxID=1658765 RepID=A0A0J7J3L2_9GAMM|nr:ABC transporter ATP-binding protein [Marinobacter subterrani]KMQ73113.1 ABC-type cobalamin/Fe3+-siderophores transport system, ATPase component [Marinobacter subterrani]
MAILTAEELIIDIPGRDAGVPLSLSLQPGQVWGVLGPNGVGKTTLLHTLAGLREPCSGQLLLDGNPLAKIRRKLVSQQMGLVFQDRQDGFPATVLETALIGRHPWLSPWQMETAEDLVIAERALVVLDVMHLRDRLVNTLSGGERQRVAIATLMTQAPGIWLLDEPTNHLDLQHQTSVMKLLRSQAASGQAVFMCLHDLNLAARWCDQILLMFPDGQACWGPARDMLVTPALERLFGQRLLSTELDGFPVFVPG